MQRFSMIRMTVVLATALLASLVQSPVNAADETVTESRPATPNVVVIFIDDMGYADINPFGARDYKTPNLNQMAAEGRRFTDFVVSSAVCSASRSALMTGCYHRRIGFSGALGPSATHGLHADELTLAELCKSKGYATACFGKWHLGHHPKFLPTSHGFDHYYGIPYSNDMWPLHPDTLRRQAIDPSDKGNWPPLPMIEGTEVVNDNIGPDDQKQMTRQFTDRAVEFIKSNEDKPFFLYLPHPMVHVPLYVSDEFQGKSGAGLFGDVVMEVDWSVGQIINAVREIGQEENTLVIFTSDNGPWLSYGHHAGSAKPLREGKGTMWEGGYREPTIMWWPGQIPASTTCDELGSSIDILPTVAKLIGGELPDHKIDGYDIAPLMFDHVGAKSPHQTFACYYKGGELQAVRNERFKLVFPHSYRTLADNEPGSDGKPNGYEMRKAELALYDLDRDIGETTDVSDQFPQAVRALQAEAEAIRNDLGDKLQKRKGKGVREAGKLEPSDPKLKW